MNVAVFAVLLTSLLREGMPLLVNLLISPVRLEWKLARDYCESINGRLVILDSEKKWEEFVAHNRYQQEQIQWGVYWIGLRFNSSLPCSSDTDNWDYSGWARWTSDEPNHCPADRCVRLTVNYMRTSGCQSQYQALCEIVISEEAGETSVPSPTASKTAIHVEYVAPTTSLGTTSVGVASIVPTTALGNTSITMTSVAPITTLGTTSIGLATVVPTTSIETTSIAVTSVAPTTSLWTISIGLATVAPTTSLETTSVGVTYVAPTTTIGTTSVELATVAPTTSLGTTSVWMTPVAPTTSLGTTSVGLATVAPTTSLGKTLVAVTYFAPTLSPGTSSIEGTYMYVALTTSLETSITVTSVLPTSFALRTTLIEVASALGKSLKTAAIEATSVVQTLNSETIQDETCNKCCVKQEPGKGDLRELRMKLRAQLIVKKSTLSIQRRKLISVYDARPSSVVMGGMACIVLVAVVGVIVVPDAIRLGEFVYKRFMT